MVNSVYACSPAVYRVAKQKLLVFNITSSTDFDEQHPAGANLTDVLYTYDSSDNKLPLTTFVFQSPELKLK